MTVNIGRPGVYGNPFHIGLDGDRATVVDKYREWLYAPEQAWLRKRSLIELPGQKLWCPGCRGSHPCHGDVLKVLIGEEL